MPNPAPIRKPALEERAGPVRAAKNSGNEATASQACVRGANAYPREMPATTATTTRGRTRPRAFNRFTPSPSVLTTGVTTVEDTKRGKRLGALRTNRRSAGCEPDGCCLLGAEPLPPLPLTGRTTGDLSPRRPEPRTGAVSVAGSSDGL